MPSSRVGGLAPNDSDLGVLRGPHAASAGALRPSCRRHAASVMRGRHAGVGAEGSSLAFWRQSGCMNGRYSGRASACQIAGGATPHSASASRRVRVRRVVTQAGIVRADRRERSDSSRGTVTVRLCYAGVCGADGPGASRRGRKARIYSGSDVARPTRPVASRAYRLLETGGGATWTADGLQGSSGPGNICGDPSRGLAPARPPTPSRRGGTCRCGRRYYSDPGHDGQSRLKVTGPLHELRAKLFV